MSVGSVGILNEWAEAWEPKNRVTVWVLCKRPPRTGFKMKAALPSIAHAIEFSCTPYVLHSELCRSQMLALWGDSND